LVSDRVFWVSVTAFSTQIDLTALRASAEAMTGAVHFAPWSKPTRVGQFWFLHAQVSHRQAYAHSNSRTALVLHGLNADQVVRHLLGAVAVRLPDDPVHFVNLNTRPLPKPEAAP
jgi:hypothetical protein